MSLPATPSQTIGPFFHIRCDVPGTESLVPADDPRAVRIQGRVLDGAGQPVSDALLELWDTSRRQFGRCATDGEGSYRFVVTKPGPRAPDSTDAPHLDVLIFARGLLDHLVTRIYFPDEEAANRDDPVLARILDPSARATLIARPAKDALRFDIHLQGDGETIFFAR
jgi:protocatechuate 3,4-dioxygenase alpha subunit